MSQQTALSFEQAPPLSLPLRFFLTAPLFLLAAACLIAWSPDTLAARWTPQALALTHALTLGFLAMAMLGALLQMLPVVAGARLPAPRWVAWFSHIPLVLGTLALIAGFLRAEPAAYGVGMVLLGGGFTIFVGAVSISLARAPAGASVTGIRLAVASLALTVLLGVALALMRAGWWNPRSADAMIAAHVSFGLLGWILLLVVGIAYQVVPMFQITPPYPPRLARWLTGTIFVLLLLHAAAPLLPEPATRLVDGGLAAGALLFALATLHLQSRRRRKLPDVTLDYWRFGMVSLILGVAAWVAAQWSPGWAGDDRYPLLLGVLFIGGFAVSVVCGMLYKIVPFLAWFHLQAQLQARAGSIPTMKEMIAAGWMRGQFRVHLVASTLLVAAIWWPRLAPAAGGALALSATLLWLNLLAAVRRFYRHGGRLA